VWWRTLILLQIFSAISAGTWLWQGVLVSLQAAQAAWAAQA
jgi:hypothetical protein